MAKENFYEGGIEYSKYLEKENDVAKKIRYGKSFRDMFSESDLDPMTGSLMPDDEWY